MTNQELEQAAIKNEEEFLEKQSKWYRKFWEIRWNTWIGRFLGNVCILIFLAIHGFLCLLTWVGLIDYE
jgi:hypothetical protein